MVKSQSRTLAKNKPKILLKHRKGYTMLISSGYISPKM